MALRQGKEVHLFGGDKQRLPLRLLRQTIDGVLKRMTAIAYIVRQPTRICQIVREVLTMQSDPNGPLLKCFWNALLKISELSRVPMSHQKQKTNFICEGILL